MTTAAEESRLCEYCCRRLPITEFRWRTRRQGRERRCRECRNAYEKAYQAQRKLLRRDKAVSQFVLEVNRARSDHRIGTLVTEMVEHFGDSEHFVQAWKQQVDRMRTQAPTGKKALDFYRAVVRMMEVSEQREPQPPQLDDAELASHLRVQMQELIVEQPELVLRVAEALGWKVIPPEESELVGSHDAASP